MNRTACTVIVSLHLSDYKKDTWERILGDFGSIQRYYDLENCSFEPGYKGDVIFAADCTSTIQQNGTAFLEHMIQQIEVICNTLIIHGYIESYTTDLQ